MYFFLCATVFLSISTANCDFVTEYYENLIYQRTAEAQVYEIPQSNAEFQTGYESTEVNDFGSYDFIVIGAGSAGSVVATRLSEIAEWNILLLEAGGEENDFNQIPSMFMFLQLSEMNWGYYSTPQTNCCLGMIDHKCMAPRGKALGGSSALNAVMYVRGNPKDYDKWVELGNPGWSYEEVLPYFIKSENSQIDGDSGYHGKGGFWNVEYALPPTNKFSNFIDGNVELNVSPLDYNGQDQLGVSKTQVNTKHGKRQSTGTAFLDNARKRKNLKVVTKALVTQINIDESSKVAQGVTFVTNDKKFSATATKEIIVSAGAINSPQLLMLSGIGPKSHLEEMGIQVIEDLPVGENLLEHPLFQGLSFHTNYSSGSADVETLITNYLNGYGPYTSPSNIDGLGFIHAGDVPEDVPMVEYLFITAGGSMMPILRRVYNYNDELTYHYLNNLNSDSDVVFYLVLLHEKSRGRVSLKSHDPIDFPNIDLNLFSEPEDIDNFIVGIEFILKLVETEAFRKINATLVDIPVCQDFEIYSRDFWDCTIRHMSMTLYHPCGTTPMGPDKTTSVVDSNLKVHGIEKLRVVDAGVFPSTISGHTNAPAVMVAEKISDVIKNDYQVLNV
ncbi:glucose dehydrogenase [FAD, quinone]-like [Asbolus verrucosus]|uniref:Glucose dehydrogenase [FAD, quinone]-like n=1 Tax=Asbolus verrucosus TaxID=1661398 RepID=A0A482V7N7_ASBVE|nr:glucose dehydrogenase [FAD, quinone]-like [Asbolus verrucosus]